MKRADIVIEEFSMQDVCSLNNSYKPCPIKMASHGQTSCCHFGYRSSFPGEERNAGSILLNQSTNAFILSLVTHDPVVDWSKK